jgi:hypothetical protein
MTRQTRWATLGLLTTGILAAANLGLGAPAPSESEEVFKDRAAFVPQRKYQPLKETTVGVLVSNVQAVMSNDGRGGPADAMGFSRDCQSYRWIYVPVSEKPLISGLNVRVGEKGEQTKTYPSLSMANAQTVKQWEITAPYALVEVEVNDRLGAPAEEGFVATKMTTLDGTKEYPIKVADAIEDAKKRYKTYLKDQEEKLEKEMTKAQKDAIKEEKATGPRETVELMYMTWLPESKSLSVRFRTKITDGAYKTGGGPNIDPPPLPPGKADPFLKVKPPPRPINFRYGTQFGVEFGVAYEFSKKGTLEKVQTLPIEAFKNAIPPPPGVDRPGRGDSPAREAPGKDI